MRRKETIYNMLIFAVRHGQTDWNLEGRFQGVTDIALNANGVAQARATGAILAELGLRQVVTSPLSRARTTGRLIAEVAGISAVSADERLIERNLGSYEGLTIASRPDYYVHLNALDGSMEPLDAVRKRMREAACALRGDSPAAIVSHGAALNALLFEVSGGMVGTGVTRLVNGCVSVLALDEACDTLALLAYNLPPQELLAWAHAQGAAVTAPFSTNAERLAALNTPVLPPEVKEHEG